jgi:hypothetical protein
MKQLLNSARFEILELRRRNEVLAAQIAVVEIFAAALGLKRNEGGMAPDVAWELQRKIDELDNEEKIGSQEKEQPYIPRNKE